uniref:Uncharacterized protein n=1 Tax=Lepeophtheirus salmonis TaxID=72036 RepID=A0A0K2UNH0_LEPSM
MFFFVFDLINCRNPHLCSRIVVFLFVVHNN